MQSPTICTIIAKNYLAHARCLTESFLAQHPDGRVFVLLADRLDDYFDPAKERFTTIEAHDLGIPQFDEMAFRYTVVEFNTAVKPFLLEYLFERYALQHLCYFDPDIYFYQPLTRLHALLAEHDVVLTPHLLDMLDDDRKPDEPYILRAGVYNLGFIGLSRGAEVQKLLRWWQQKLKKDCVIDPARGLFVDQRWIDLVPGFFEKVAILHDPGYNAAYWNLKHRRIQREQGGWMVNDLPLTFYHFSGLPTEDIDAISRHQDRYTLQDLPALAPLFSEYRDRLTANGFEIVRRWPYAYGFFDNDIVLPNAARHLWRNIDEGVRWPKPFSTAGSGSFFNWLNQEVKASAQRRVLISNLAMELYRQRWDLQQRFPDVLGSHHDRYVNWFVATAETQYHLDPLFVQPMRERLATTGLSRATGGAANGKSPLSTNTQAQSFGLRLYAAVRAPLRRLGLNKLLKRMLGPRTVDRMYAAIARIGAPLPEAPLLGQPTLQRRLYYMVRNPLRLVGLHEPLKKLVGRRAVERIHATMVMDPPVPPEARVRSAASVLHRRAVVAPNERGAPPADLLRGLNVVGYLCAETGVGEVSRSILRALEAADYPVAQTDLSNATWARAQDHSMLHLPTGNPYGCTLLCVNADLVPATFQRLGPEFFANKYVIGFWHWETANFPQQWHDRFDYLDEIWVDSCFIQKALAAISPIPVVNVQLPVNAIQLSGQARHALDLPEDRFRFLFSFDMQSFIQRKNPHGLIEAYRRAFGPAFDKTTLVIKITNSGAFPRETARLRADLESVAGILIDTYIDRSALSDLFAACDAYVSLHRSEGFGLTMAEAMALGKPVIATAYSGNMEFMTLANSYLVSYRVVDIDGNYGPYRPGDAWAEPDLDHAAELMRQVVADPAEVARRVANAAEDIRRFFSSEAVARRMIARLDHIGQQSRGRSRRADSVDIASEIADSR